MSADLKNHENRHWAQALRDKLLSAFGRAAPPPAAPAPPPAPEVTPEQKIKQSPLWGNLMFDVMGKGQSEPDPEISHRVRVIGVRPAYRVYRTLPCDIVTLKMDEDTVTLRAKPGGSVFVAKMVDWEDGGKARRTGVYTHISTDAESYSVDIRDKNGKPYDDAARPQKFIDLMAAMRAQQNPNYSRYEGLDKLAEEVGLRVPETPPVIAKPAPPDIDVLKPATIQRRVPPPGSPLKS